MNKQTNKPRLESMRDLGTFATILENRVFDHNHGENGPMEPAEMVRLLRDLRELSVNLGHYANRIEANWHA